MLILNVLPETGLPNQAPAPPVILNEVKNLLVGRPPCFIIRICFEMIDIFNDRLFL